MFFAVPLVCLSALNVLKLPQDLFVAPETINAIPTAKGPERAGIVGGDSRGWVSKVRPSKIRLREAIWALLFEVASFVHAMA